MNISKFVALASAVTLGASVLFAQAGSSPKFYELNFVKGNLEDKSLAVKDAAASGDFLFALKAIEFAVQSYSIIGADPELEDLAENSIRTISSANPKGHEKQINSSLSQIFKAFDSERVVVAAIDAFSLCPTQENVQLVNQYFSKKMQDSADVDEALLKAVLFMGANGNSASFNLLFIADILDVWPAYSQVFANAYGPLAEASEKEILNMVSSVPNAKKVKILDRLNKNSKISKKIRGEAAENALSTVIYNNKGGKSSDVSEIDIELQLVSLKTISDTKWTRASSLATEYFSIARSEYETNRMDDNQFISVISSISSVATSETGQVLSSYLDSLNKLTEQNQHPVKAVVLSVINTLGELGDKTAFDYLLYVTYLDYPEDVIFAAKSALAKLKW